MNFCFLCCCNCQKLQNRVLKQAGTNRKSLQKSHLTWLHKQQQQPNLQHFNSQVKVEKEGQSSCFMSSLNVVVLREPFFPASPPGASSLRYLGAASVIWEQLPFIFYFVMQRIDQRKYITTTSSIIWEQLPLSGSSFRSFFISLCKE